MTGIDLKNSTLKQVGFPGSNLATRLGVLMDINARLMIRYFCSISLVRVTLFTCLSSRMTRLES